MYHHGPNVIGSIKNILSPIDPNCDWLEDRKRELSDKAKHNQQQKEEQEAIKASKKRKLSNRNSSIDSIESELVMNESVSSSGRIENNLLKSLIRKALKDVLIDQDILPEEWQPAVVAFLGKCLFISYSDILLI